MAQGNAWPQKIEINFINHKLGFVSEADCVRGKTRLQMLRGYREGLLKREKWPEDLNKASLLRVVDNAIRIEESKMYGGAAA